MAELILKTAGGDRRIEFSPDRSLREVLDATSFRVRSGCRGTGACGLCRVRVRSDEPDVPTPVERIYLSDDQIASGIRLACQVRPRQDMEVLVLERDPVTAWRAISPASPCYNARSAGFPLASPALNLPKDVQHPYGAAVDLGTTHVSVSFYDLLTGKWFAGRHGLNPQVEYGTDVMTRLTAASESRELAKAMRRQAIDAIGSAIIDVAAREGLGPEQVVRLALVGNTAMLGLLSGRNYHLLLQPAHWMRPVDCLPESPGGLSADWGIHPEAAVEIFPPLAGFVGSDLLAGCIAMKLIEGDPGSLLIDFGTNSEIALWDGEVLWVTSAAGGPAFEGCGISCGVSGESGAIYQVRDLEYREGRSAGDSPLSCAGCRLDAGKGITASNVLGLDLQFKTIDGENPSGFCGSGIVDLIACLVRSGKLTGIGRFAADISNDGFVLLDGERKLVLTKRDVDIFQRAKAAINAAVRILLSMARMNSRDLRRIYIGGAFGHFLNMDSAVDVGLLPDMDHEAVQLCGNTALSGCAELLMSPGAEELLAGLAAKARVVNLSQCTDFDDFFLDGLYLKRWPEGG